MKYTKKNANEKVTAINAELDAIQAIFNGVNDDDWFDFACSDKGHKLFDKQQRLARQWLHWYPYTLPRAELVKKLRWS